MKVKYTAIGGNNQKLEGVLDAESVQAAREELHKMNFSIVAINEISEEEATRHETQTAPLAQQSTGETGVAETASAAGQAGKTPIVTYYFTAKDPGQKDVNGTIDAPDPQSAYRRLITEYQFTITDLYPDGSPDPAAASMKSQFEIWKTELEDEGYDLSTRPSKGTKSELEDEGEEMSAEIVTEIDQFIINTKKILSNHKEQYSDAFFREIENTLGELERIRASNNLKHITKVCNDLYELVAHPDIAQKETDTPTENTQEYQTIVKNMKGSGFVSNPLAFLEAHSLKKKSVRFEKIQDTFAKIISGLNKKQGEVFSQKLQGKKKSRQAKWIAQLSRSLKGKKEVNGTPFKLVARKFFEWITASNTILRRAKKQEMVSTFRAWKKYRAQLKAEKVTGKKPEITEEKEAENESGLEGAVSNFFMEVDSFIGWLLFFYLTYFFLASFSLEKDIGLPQDLVLKTFNTDLLVNIAIFLVIAHLAFTLKLRFFRGHFLSSVFLFFLSFGIYAILVVNF